MKAPKELANPSEASYDHFLETPPHDQLQNLRNCDFSR